MATKKRKVTAKEVAERGVKVTSDGKPLTSVPKKVPASDVAVEVSGETLQEMARRSRLMSAPSVEDQGEAEEAPSTAPPVEPVAPAAPVAQGRPPRVHMVQKTRAQYLVEQILSRTGAGSAQTTEHMIAACQWLEGELNE